MHLCSGLEKKKTAECSHFPFKEQVLPRRQLSSSYSDLSCRSFGKFASSQSGGEVCDLVHCLFMRAYGLSQEPECSLKVSNVCASQNPCLYLE